MSVPLPEIMTLNHAPDLQDIKAAYARIQKKIHKTPVFSNETLCSMLGHCVYMKAECFQKTGSFKARGALNAATLIKSNNLASGITSHSSGNHGQALAWACQQVELPCTIVTPHTSASVKTDAIKSYNAELVYCEPTIKSRLETCQKVAEEESKAVISPYDNYDVLAGQGTIGLEFMSQVPNLDAIFASVGGGAMITGTAIAAKEINPNIKIYAVEPEGKMLAQCLYAGERLWPNPPVYMDTIADGLRSQQLGHLVWPIAKNILEPHTFAISDEQIIDAMKFAWTRFKLIIEPSSAIVIAALLDPNTSKLLNKYFSIDTKNSNHRRLKIGVILCGGNVDLDNLPWMKGN